VLKFVGLATTTEWLFAIGVGFMVWLWLSAVIVLLGGELNAETEHQTARDTTEGGSMPLGSRGAMVADHVGKAQ
jgi:membrane protein